MNSSPEDIAMNRYHISSGVTLLAGLLALPTSASLAQWAAVAGRVTDSASHHPLVSAQVYVGGTTGSGRRTRSGGSNSLSLSNEPVIYVDGIRVENGASSISVGVGGQTPSRLNDINPNDLETVQVAGGPSSSVLYGTDAANGVIQVQTKQGKPGPTRWEVYAEGGVLNDIATYPANYRGADSRDPTCTLINQLAGACVQTQLHVFNPIETFSPFRTGHRQEYGVAASGGPEVTTYYVSSHWNQELGV